MVTARREPHCSRTHRCFPSHAQSEEAPEREREREREREKEREEKKEARGRLNYESHPRKAEDEVRKSWDAETCAENH